MNEHYAPGAREAAGPDDGDDVRAHARRALQDSYDWRDDDHDQQRRPAAAGATPGSEVDAHAARAAARRLRRSTSRTVGV
jgi:hypothetical protein